MLERASLAVLAGLGLFAAACSETKPSDVRVVTNVLVTGVAPVVGASMQYTATAVWSDGVQENVTTAAEPTARIMSAPNTSAPRLAPRRSRTLLKLSPGRREA